MGENFGLTECVSMALGGMIGGGIYAVLGVVTQITGAATWFAFILAGVVALCAGYSYTKLNELADQNGGSVTFVQCFTGNSTLAGMTGWTLLFGYIGSMAMYAFAFSEFTLSLPGIPHEAAGVPLRPVVSVGIVGLFVALNTLGARITGTAENILVGLKVGILVIFGVAGIAYVLFVAGDSLSVGAGQLSSFSPIMAAGVSFVAFQGWQLLFYDQESIADSVETIRTAVYVSIPAAVAVYILVAVATFNLAPQALQHHPHTALKSAAGQIGSVVGLASVGGFVLALSALFSTGSAINATLFSSGYFAKGLISKELLPDRIGDPDSEGVPSKAVWVLGIVTAVFTVSGSLEVITNFASLSFIVVFGAMSLLAFQQRDQETVRAAIPAVGAVGAFSFLLLMLWHLYRTDAAVFGMVLVLSVAVIGVELLYFERDFIEQEVDQFESTLGDSI